MDPELTARVTPDFSARKTAKSRPLAGRLGRRGERAPSGGDPDRREDRNRLAMRLTLVAAVWSLGLVIAALVLPVYNGETVSNSIGTTFVTETLVAGQGAWVLIPVAVPLVLCGVVALALRRKRGGTDARSGRVAWAAVGLLTAFALFAILSIGAFAIPVALLLARATMLTAPAVSTP